MILPENRFPLFGIMRVRQVSRPGSRIIVDGGGESAGVRPRIDILAHDLVRKPVPTFRDHALDAVELAFLGDAFEGLAGTLDPVLVVVAFRRQQLEHRIAAGGGGAAKRCLLYTSPSPRDRQKSRMPSSA